MHDLRPDQAEFTNAPPQRGAFFTNAPDPAKQRNCDVWTKRVDDRIATLEAVISALSVRVAELEATGERHILRSCNACDWTGPESDCVHPKHVPEMVLCPLCHETTDVQP